MKRALDRPITYLITSGEVTCENFASAKETLLNLVKGAADAGVSLIQIREKQLDAAPLFSLVKDAASITQPSGTLLLVNDRADVAVAAGADGVHLTSKSLPPNVVREAFGEDLLIAVSTHSAAEAEIASSSGADLIVFGPVFRSPRKGEPVGVGELAEVCRRVEGVPVLGLGGISMANLGSVLDTGAAGFAAIRLLNDPKTLATIVMEAQRQR